MCGSSVTDQCIPNQKVSRIRCAAHLAWLRTLPCCVPSCRSGLKSVVHHLLSGPEGKARSVKASDRYSIPLCDPHHNPGSPGSVHHDGNERRWCEARGIDPVEMADRLWTESLASGRTPDENKPHAKPTRQIPAKKFTVSAKPWHGGKRKINNRGWKP